MRQDLLQQRLSGFAEPSYAQFTRKLVTSERMVVGVRTPVLNKLAHTLAKQEGEQCLLDFLQSEQPWYEEVILTYKAFALIPLPFEKRRAYLKRLRPYNDSWATNDTLAGSLGDLNEDRSTFYSDLSALLVQSNAFDVRLGIVSLMLYFLEEPTFTDVLEVLSHVDASHYYVLMALGWAYATAFCKDREKTFAYLKQGRLAEPVRKKAIQKCIESRLVSPEDKILLRELRHQI
ncbi:MAG: DNA alkylation repair protein [Sphaerochaeta sp.]|uniref:DNA alkylation repair protein n=1 Tax=Sphaerochaeta sp. TaxID=1972642 RepID=UPI002FC5B046